MKKLLVICALLFVLVACVKPAMEEKQAAPVVEEKVAEPVEEVGRKPPVRALPSENVDEGQPATTTGTSAGPSGPTVTVESKEMSPQLRELLKRADEKLSSLRYLFGGTETGNLFKDRYDVKGTKVVLHKYSEDYYVREGYYDTVYIDTVAKTAVGCCVERSRCISHNVDNTKEKFDLDYATLSIPKTPYQWTKEIKYATVVGPQTFNQRSVTFIKYALDDGSEVRMWVDDTYGVPHKVEIEKGGNIIWYQFNDMLFNSLKDADFVAPCA
jgi:hypothetical protein